MTEDTKVYWTSSSYELGDLQKIEEIDELKENKQILNTLLTLGLDQYSKSKVSAMDMAKRSILNTLQKTNISREDIDALVYASYSFEDSGFYLHRHIGNLIDELGLENAYPIGTFLSGCGNLHTAIRIAKNLIKSQECKNILVVTTDVVSKNISRIVQPNISVLSDAAASFILTSCQTEGEFEVLSNNQHMNAKISHINPEFEPLEYLEKVMEGIKQTCAKSLIKVKKESKNSAQIITNNYNISVSKTICDVLDFNFEQNYSKNISRFAHASAADNVINLCDFSTNQSFLTDELVLLLGTGPSTWGCTVLSKL